MSDDRLTVADIDQEEVAIARGICSGKMVHLDIECPQLSAAGNPDWTPTHVLHDDKPVCMVCGGQETDRGAESDGYKIHRKIEAAREKGEL